MHHERLSLDPWKIPKVSQLVATQRTREECPPSQIRAILPILRNFLLVIDQDITALQRLCTQVEDTLVSLDSAEEGRPNLNPEWVSFVCQKLMEISSFSAQRTFLK